MTRTEKIKTCQFCSFSTCNPRMRVCPNCKVALPRLNPLTRKERQRRAAENARLEKIMEELLTECAA